MELFRNSSAPTSKFVNTHPSTDEMSVELKGIKRVMLPPSNEEDANSNDTEAENLTVLCSYMFTSNLCSIMSHLVNT